MGAFKIVPFIMSLAGYVYNYFLLLYKPFGVEALSGEILNQGYFIAFNVAVVLVYLVGSKTMAVLRYVNLNLLWVIHGALVLGLPYDFTRLPGAVIMAAGILSLVTFNRRVD